MERYLITGLGNSGREYAANRHNVGFRCVERLAAAHGLSFDRRQKRARVALGTIGDQPVVLARPRTFMNKSGSAVAGLVHFYRVPLERVLVSYDDLDLPLGTLRLRSRGGSGGHKGMRSVIKHLGSRDFPRLRIGIGRPPGRMEPAIYVLQDFSADEEPVLKETLARSVATIETWLQDGIEAAMTRHNRSAERERLGASGIV